MTAPQVHIVASLPCYSQKNVDAQRGSSVFERSIRALQLLNSLGYGQAGSGLELDLVYNPGGAFLAPPQVASFSRPLWFGTDPRYGDIVHHNHRRHQPWTWTLNVVCMSLG